MALTPTHPLSYPSVPLEERLNWTGPKREKVLLNKTCCDEPLVALRFNGKWESVYCQGHCHMPYPTSYADRYKP